VKKTLLNLLILLFLVSYSFCFAEETIVVATGDWPPTLGKDLKHYGYANHMLKLAFETQGIKVKFKFLPWKRAEISTKNGEYHVTNYWFCSESRKNDFLCGDTLFNTSYYFFHLKSNKFDWKNYNDLKKYKIGLTSGYTYTDEFVKMVNNGELTGYWVPKDKQNFAKLLLGRIDIFPIGDIEGLYKLKRDNDLEQFNKVTYHPKPLTIGSVHPLFPKSRSDSKKLLQLYNKGIEIVISKGLLQQYKDKLIEGWYDK
jgi:polar amino acid transport system substrate-binding protein